VSAKECLQKSLTYDPENKTIQKEIEKVEKEMKMAQEKDDQEIAKLLKTEGTHPTPKNDECLKIEEINTYAFLPAPLKRERTS
jgi:phosphopantetheinyl transferase (holo-ACP synthase)